MLKTDVLAHFKTQAAVARALGITKGAVSQWEELVPERMAHRLQLLTRNKLKVDPAKYGVETGKSAKTA